MTLKTLDDIDVNNKIVGVRVDLNVPMQDGIIQDNTRIKAIIPTINRLLASGAKIFLISHLGRPKLGSYAPKFSLLPVAKRLNNYLETPVRFVRDWLQGFEIANNEVILCENARFLAGETTNEDILAKQIANLLDLFVMDAFAVSHRNHASTVGAAKYASCAVAGPLFIKEIQTLSKLITTTAKPVLAIVSGAKIATKLKLLENLLKLVDVLVVGGGIANTFLVAQGQDVGKSLYDSNFVVEARSLLSKALSLKKTIIVPIDVIVAKDVQQVGTVKTVANIDEMDKIFDIGPKTTKQIVKLLATAGTIIWNGPLGVFETLEFSKGTMEIGRAVANSRAWSVAGGGDTLRAINNYNIAKDIDYLSTGGGAFLTYLQGDKLPIIDFLTKY